VLLDPTRLARAGWSARLTSLQAVELATRELAQAAGGTGGRA
jgi:hypothetical protein